MQPQLQLSTSSDPLLGGLALKSLHAKSTLPTSRGARSAGLPLMPPLGAPGTKLYEARQRVEQQGFSRPDATPGQLQMHQAEQILDEATKQVQQLQSDLADAVWKSDEASTAAATAAEQVLESDRQLTQLQSLYDAAVATGIPRAEQQIKPLLTNAQQQRQQLAKSSEQAAVALEEAKAAARDAEDAHQLALDST